MEYNYNFQNNSNLTDSEELDDLENQDEKQNNDSALAYQKKQKDIAAWGNEYEKALANKRQVAAKAQYGTSENDPLGINMAGQF